MFANTLNCGPNTFSKVSGAGRVADYVSEIDNTRTLKISTEITKSGIQRTLVKITLLQPNDGVVDKDLPTKPETLGLTFTKPVNQNSLGLSEMWDTMKGFFLNDNNRASFGRGEG